MAHCRMILLLALSLLVTASLTGCTTWATYPPIEGAAQIGHPKLEPTPTILADALRYTHERHGEGELVFNLPEGAPVDLYAILQRRLRDARPMREGDESAIHVQQIRIRANTAEVDLIYPQEGGYHALATLHMRQRFLASYRVTSTRLWRIRVDVPSPNYVPPAEPESGYESGSQSGHDSGTGSGTDSGIGEADSAVTRPITSD